MLEDALAHQSYSGSEFGMAVLSNFSDIIWSMNRRGESIDKIAELISKIYRKSNIKYLESSETARQTLEVKWWYSPTLAKTQGDMKKLHIRHLLNG